MTVGRAQDTTVDEAQEMIRKAEEETGAWRRETTEDEG